MPAKPSRSSAEPEGNTRSFSRRAASVTGSNKNRAGVPGNKIDRLSADLRTTSRELRRWRRVSRKHRELSPSKIFFFCGLILFCALVGAIAVLTGQWFLNRQRENYELELQQSSQNDISSLIQAHQLQRNEPRRTSPLQLIPFNKPTNAGEESIVDTNTEDDSIVIPNSSN